MSQPPGAGHGEEGDASSQGPAQDEEKAQKEALPARPKPTNADTGTDEDDTTDRPSGVIALSARIKTQEAAPAGGAKRGGLVTVQPKPPKRKNARERAREKYAKGGTTPVMTAKAKPKAEKEADKETARKPHKKKGRKAGAASVA